MSQENAPSPKIVVHISMPRELHDCLKAKAASQGQSMTRRICDLIAKDAKRSQGRMKVD